jgi:predicted Zn-dependent protease
LVALIMVIVALVGYYGQRSYNPVTRETQHVAMTPDQEIALGLQAAPQMEAQFGGPSDDRQGQALVASVGARLVQRTEAGQTPYRFQFHLLNDSKTVNAFALPGGQVFITEALGRKLRSEGELAGVVGHEIGHVVARHGAEHLAKAQLVQGLGGAAVIATYDPDRPGSSAQHAIIAQAIGQLINMRFSRQDELEADRLGVRLMGGAGYDPRSMIRVMEVLAAAGRGGARPPEFFSTHPSPENRIPRIRQAIEELYPQGVPEGLTR